MYTHTYTCMYVYIYMVGVPYIIYAKIDLGFGDLSGVSEGAITAASDAAEAGALQEMCLGKV